MKWVSSAWELSVPIPYLPRTPFLQHGEGPCSRQRTLCQPGLGREGAVSGAEPQPMYESLESWVGNTTWFSAAELLEAVWCLTLTNRFAKAASGIRPLLTVAFFTLHSTKIWVAYS